MKSSFLSICEKSCYICDKSQYGEASFFSKLKLNIHLLYCKSCKKYSKQNTKLTKLVSESDLKAMCSERKKEMENLIASEIKKK